MKHEFDMSIKIDCPYCKAKKAFRKYKQVNGQDVVNDQGELCGICDRANSCGVFAKPDGTVSGKIRETVVKKDVFIVALDTQSKELLKSWILNQQSNFHKFCRGLGITEKHLKRWGVGTDKDCTVFAFIDQAKQPCNIKRFRYKADGHRDKDFNAYSLKGYNNNDQDYKYKICLFGEHLLSDDKERVVMMVESEKTAIIASFFYPTFDWLSCASADGLTDTKASVLKDRMVIWLCDADKKGRENSSLRTLHRQRIKHKKIDLQPLKNDGSDICDMIVEGERPNLKQEILFRSLEPSSKQPYKAQIYPRKRTRYYVERRQLMLQPTPFKEVITDDILADINKLDGFLKIRVGNTENEYDLQFLALIEDVLYYLKTGIITAEGYNRKAWMHETLKRDRTIKQLREDLADCLTKNATAHAVIHDLQRLAMKNAKQIKTLQY